MFASRLWTAVPFLLLGVLPSGCDMSDPDPRHPNGPLLPLDVGNEWVLRSSLRLQDSTRYDTVRVLQKDMLTGRSVFVVENVPGVEDTVRLRSDTRGRIFQIRDGREHLWFDPTVPDSGSYTYSGPHFDTYTVTVTRNVTVETPAGAFGNGIRFWFDTPEVVDEEHGYTLVPGVGIVRQTPGFSPWSAWTLVSQTP